MDIQNEDLEENKPEAILKSYPCKYWGLSFLNESQLGKHMKVNH